MFDKFAEDVVARCIEKLAFLANKYNFAHGTSSLFSRTKKRPDRKPDKLSPKKGSDSEYWITPSGVIRGSDHWGTVGSCSWDLAGSPDHPGKKVYGFSPWENFEKKAASIFDNLDKPMRLGYNKSPAGRRVNLLGRMDYAPLDEFERLNFNQILQIGRKTTQINNPVKENNVVSMLNPRSASRKPVNINQTVALSDPRKLLDNLLRKKIMGFNKTAFKKALGNYY